MEFKKDHFPDGFMKEFGEAFYNHHKDLLHIAKGYIMDDFAADGVVKELWIRFLRMHRDGRLKKDQLNYPYLVESVKNACKDYIKKNKDNPGIRMLFDTDSDELPEPDEGVEVRAEMWRLLEKWISDLPKQQGIIIRKVCLEGKSIAEVAEEMGLAEGTVRSHHWKAIKQLKERRKKEEWGGIPKGLIWPMLGI